MTVNVFEGARRLAMLVAALWSLGVGYYALVESSPRITASYIITGPSAAPIRGDCGNDYSYTRREYRTLSTKQGTDAHISFCFLPQIFANNQKLIPYRTDSQGLIWGNQKYSSEVSEYAERVARNFTLSAADEQWLDERWWPERWESLKDSAGVLLGGLAAIWIISKIIGWIVRGFAGISSARDHKPKIK